MYTGIDEPQVVKGDSIVGALELQVAIKWVLVDKFIDEELDFIKSTNVILLVLNLEVAVGLSAIFHIDHVQAIEKASKLII